MSKSLLIVDDEQNIRNFLKIAFEKNNCSVFTASTVDEALKVFDAHYLDLIITDYKLPHKDGLELIKKIKESKDEVDIIMMTAYGDVDIAVEAMKLGAKDFISKPFEFEDLLKKSNVIFSLIDIKNQRDLLLKKAKDNNKYHDIIANSSAMKEVFDLIQKVAPLNSTVMINGETGTGKELVAKAIHDNSLRKDENFIAINCTTLTESLLESELFGFEKGAFTDAKSMKKGLFELADKGTILFDEIGDMPVNLQAKLLRVLQDKKIRRIGGERDISVDVRIVTATNKNLKELVDLGQFRDDLYFRLNVFPIELPALKDRDYDVILLAEEFIRQYSKEFSKKTAKMSAEFKEALIHYHWPGNIRELKNMIERIVILSSGSELKISDLPQFLQNTSNKSTSDISFKNAKKESVARFEKDYIIQKLIQTNGNVKKAAELSQLDRTVLQRYLKKLDINPLQFKK